MNIEEKIFKKLKIDYTKLLDYGFVKENNTYKFSKKIMNNTFEVQISINKDGSVNGKVFDKEFEDEYVIFRMENAVGKFVGKVREEYENILKDIAEKCTEKQYFNFEQSNRIANLIIKKYGNNPEFLWDKFPGYGVFRNKYNNKWYGIIMNIPRNRVDVGENEVEIIDLKLSESRVQDLLSKNGFYKSYHMNKKSWIAIILDNELSDKEIMKIIDESYREVDNSNK